MPEPYNWFISETVGFTNLNPTAAVYTPWPRQPPVGEGHRPVGPNETLQEGDESWCSPDEDTWATGEWAPIGPEWIGLLAHEISTSYAGSSRSYLTPFRRPVRLSWDGWPLGEPKYE